MEQPLQCKTIRRTRAKEEKKSQTSMQKTTPATAFKEVRILPQFKPVLDFLEVKDDTFTRLEIFRHLADYIKKKSLYDPDNPSKVYCDNDQLGDIFGCKEFSTANVCDLLLQNLEDVPTPENSTSSTAPSCLPSTSAVGRTESSYMQSISETATDVVTDTSDDLFFLNETDEERVVKQFVSESEVSLTADTDDENAVRLIESDRGMFSVEYEPISYSEEERLTALQGFYSVSKSASTSQSSGAVVPAANDATDSTASETNDSYGRLKCLLCCKAPPNGCMVHGRTGHQVCCLTCAQKLKDDNKPCPVCRKKIGKVIKNFM